MPLGNDDASSSDVVLTLKWFSPLTEEEENRLIEYKLHAQQWGDTAYKSRYNATFTANMMSWVDPTAVTINSGNISNRKKCTLELDLDTYCTSYHMMLLDKASGDGDEGN